MMAQNPFSPAQIDFSQLANLPLQYQQGQQWRQQQDLSNTFKDGLPMQNGAVDFNTMAQMFAQGGDPRTAASLAQTQANTEFRREQMNRPAQMTPYQQEQIKLQRDKMAAAGAKKNDFAQGGQQVLGMIDQLEQKITSKPELFEEATGPLAGEAANLPIWRPERMFYEATQGSESKAYLDQIKQDAQGINTVMQRALLKGGGQITENEREQINQILGKIDRARSADDAKALLDNFRGVVTKLFAGGGDTMEASTPVAPDSLAEGQIVSGYRFIGGNPNDQTSWEPAQ